ncbi:MAG: ABC transporter ATP-binding protein/permease [Bacteroides sp.]|nr:ABC transporter ATP-binding protein/permease [Eubacterium sp.]MCM1417466.1 ABC transporter ATP-binding protein/permease [Roseburia sp.]MCM1461646.1 ABC transporter ATP-binding protein/permease [Bacteroides sp.]
MPKNKKDKKEKVVFPTLRFFFSAAWRTDKRYFVLSVLHMLIVAVIPFVDLYFLPLMIDGLTADEPNVTLILIYAGLMVAIDAALNMIGAVMAVELEKYDDKFMNYFSETIAARCMEMDFVLTEDKDALDQIKKAQDGMGWSGGVHRIATSFFTILSNFITLCGVIVLLTLSAPWLLLIIGGLMIVNGLINKKVNDIEVDFYKNLSGMDRVFGYVIWQLEDFRFGKDVRLYGAAGMMIEKATQQIKRISAHWEAQNHKVMPLQLLDCLMGAIRDFGTYLYLGAIAILGYITIGVFSQLVTASGTLQSSVQNMIYELQNVVKYTSYGYEVVKFMNYPPRMEKGTKKAGALQGEHTIEFRDVSFAYPKTDKRILDHVSITLRSGDKLSIVGLNGAGKTTFIKLLCRLYDVDEGEILLDGVNIKEYDYDEYMKFFSVVFQDFCLLAFSVEDNILLGKEARGDTVDRVLEKVGLSDRVRSFPRGKETMMFRQFDKNGVEPSGGEQQKLALARALYKDAPIVILDEPTAALDPVAEYEIYRQFNDLVKGKTAVYISHRLSSCKFCDRIAVFSGGTIAEYGTHDELVRKENGIYAEMFRAQAQYYV